MNLRRVDDPQLNESLGGLEICRGFFVGWPSLLTTVWGGRSHAKAFLFNRAP